MALNPYGTTGSFADQLEAWLRQRGISSSAGEDGGTNYFRGGGDDGNRQRILGSPFGEEGRPDFQHVDINGTNFTRLGSEPSAFQDWRAFGLLQPNITYDPTYGYIAPTDIFNQAQGQSYTGGGRSFLDDPLTLAVTGGRFGLNEALQAAPVVGAATLTAGGAAGLAGVGPMAAGTGTGAGVGGGLTAAELDALAAGGGAGGGTSGAYGFMTPAGEVAGNTAGFAGSVGGPFATAAEALPAWATPAATTAGTAAATSATGGGGGGTTAPAGSALSRIIDGTATTADWAQVLGTGAGMGLDYLAGNRQLGILSNELSRNRAERAPFLGAATNWLNNPSAYLEGPGQAAMKGTLAGLSAKFGNPIGSGTALALANEAGLRDWRDAVTGFGNMGLSGADTRANLASGRAGAVGNIYGGVAEGISDLINPRRSLSDLMQQYKLVLA